MYIDTHYLNYDLSKDRRYIYMSFMYRYSGYDGEEGAISEGGVYIFDWWEEKFYKVYEPMPVNDFKELSVQKMKPDGSIYYEIDVKVVNNTDDGYVYAMWAGTNEDFQYVRFKNPEEMFKQYIPTVILVVFYKPIYFFRKENFSSFYQCIIEEI